MKFFLCKLSSTSFNPCQMTTMPCWIILLISYFQHYVFGDARCKTCRSAHSFQRERLAELFCWTIQKKMFQGSWLHGKYKANTFHFRSACCYSYKLKSVIIYWSKIYFNLQMPKHICAASYMPENTVNDDSNTDLQTLQRLYSVLGARCYVSYIWPLKEEKMLAIIPAVWKTPGGSSVVCPENKSIGLWK